MMESNTSQTPQTSSEGWVIECPFDPPHTHEFPSDWYFGASGVDFTADPRWQPSNYQYFDEKLTILHITSAPKCDDEAIDMFSTVANWFPTRTPKWIQVKRPGESKFETLPVEYDAETDEVIDK
jgi:hypothetical protein